MNIIDQIETEEIERISCEIPDFRAGDTIRVGVYVREGERVRVQNYEGVCISRKGGKNLCASFTVRKVSYGEGVERVFPLYSPSIKSIEITRRGRVRRAKLYYLRNRRGRSAKIKEDNHIVKFSPKNLNYWFFKEFTDISKFMKKEFNVSRDKPEKAHNVIAALAKFTRSDEFYLAQSNENVRNAAIDAFYDYLSLKIIDSANYSDIEYDVQQIILSLIQCNFFHKERDYKLPQIFDLLDQYIERNNLFPDEPASTRVFDIIAATHAVDFSIISSYGKKSVSVEVQSIPYFVRRETERANLHFHDSSLKVYSESMREKRAPNLVHQFSISSNSHPVLNWSSREENTQFDDDEEFLLVLDNTPLYMSNKSNDKKCFVI